MSKTIALTGATGFLGQHLLKALLSEGHSVRALARRPEAINFTDAKLSIIKGDLESDLSLFLQDADCVIHLAGLIKARTWKDYAHVNVKGAKNVAQAAESVGVKHFILMSSMAARAPELSFYAKSKYNGEEAVKEAFSADLSIIRAPAVFGPHDKATKPIFDLMKKGLLPVVGGKGWRIRSVAMVYIDDLVEDIVQRAVKGDYKGKTVSPATLGAMTMPEFAGYAGKALKKTVRAFSLPLFIIYPVAAITTITLRLFSLGHLSLGKLAEFRYEHWQSDDSVSNPTPMVEAIAETIRSYNNSDDL